MTVTVPKKIRNEERIKYIFKRVNKRLLKNFIKQKGLQNQDVNIAKGLMITYYFSGTAFPTRTEDAKPVSPSDPIFKKIFKQAGLSRTELKKILSNGFYSAAVSQSLDNIIEQLVEDRNKKLSKIIDELQENLYYSQNKEDVTALKQSVKRIPWSIKEMMQSIQVFQNLVLKD